MCHVKAALGGGVRKRIAGSFISCRLPFLGQGEREPFRQQIMMQTAALYLCAIF